MNVKKTILAALTLSVASASYSATLVNEDFTGVTPVVINDTTGVDINGINYKGYQAATGGHAGQGLGDGTVVTEVVDDGGDITIRTWPTETTNGNVAWDANGLPVVGKELAYVEVALPLDSRLYNVNYKVRKSATSYWWASMRYTTDGGTSWAQLQQNQITSTHFDDVALAWTGDLIGVDAVRIYVWANGGSNPGNIFIDDIFVESSISQVVDSVSSPEPTTTVAFKGAGRLQPVYNFNVDISGVLNPVWSLKDLTIADTASTAVANDVTEFKLFSTGAATTFNFSTAVEIATDTAITPANLGSTFSVTTPPAMASGNNYFWLVADIDVAATLDNVIKIQVPSVTLNNGADSVQAVTNAVNVGSIVIKDGTIDRAITLDGTNYVDFGTHSELNLNNVFTFECLFNATDLTAQRTIMGCNSNSGFYGLKLAVNADGSISYGFKASGAGAATPADRNQTSAIGLVNTNTWYHIAVVYDGQPDSPDNDLIVYLDGVEADRLVIADVAAGVGSGAVWNKPFRFIGKDYYGSNFVGRIDEVRLWNVARTANELSNNIMSDGSKLHFYVPLDEFTANMVGGDSTMYNFRGPVISTVDTTDILGVADAVSIDPISVAPGEDIYNINPTLVLSDNVMSNDYSASNTQVYAHLLSPASVAGLTLNTDGSFTFDPSLNSNNPVTLTYELTDSASAGGTQLTTETVTITDGESIHLWTFEDSLEDVLGSADGTFPSGTATYTTSGQTGKALTLNGTTEHVIAPVSLGTGNIEFTLEAWIYPTAVPGSPLRIFSTYGDDLGILLEPEMNIRAYSADTTVGSVTIEDNTKALTINEWHHIAVTHDSTTFSLYQDGELVASAPAVFNSPVTNNLFLGSNVSGEQLFTGNLDEVQAYNYALTAAQINDSFTPAIGLVVEQSGVKFTWSIDEEIGVKEYHVIDSVTGDVITVLDATGDSSYSVTLPEGVLAKLVVVDNSGFTQTFYPENGDIRTVAYNLSEGWNLITITTENADLSNLKKMISGDLWTWDGNTYQVTTEPQPTQGVWVYAPNATEVTVSGTKSDAEMTIFTGWNLVGPVENSSAPVEATVIYNWNDIYESIATDQGVLLQGVGYWIFSF